MRSTPKKTRSKNTHLLAYKRSAPIAIPESREDEKARADRIEAAVICAVHDWIWANRPPWCQLCQGRRRAECAGFPDEMHEEPSRAKTRGLPPEQRFNLIVCGRLCKKCHQDVTENKIQIVFDDAAAGFMRGVRAVAKTTEV